ncbi:MAG: hypothetical protein Q8M07_18460 [Prosthecobacter sp.]|nr:hypothetical protein [Prosthecobacter sp.]
MKHILGGVAIFYLHQSLQDDRRMKAENAPVLAVAKRPQALFDGVVLRVP